MTSKISKEQRLFIRPTSTMPADTHYYEPHTLQYTITNISGSHLLIESLTLQFEPDMETAPNYVDHACGFRLKRRESKTVAIEVTPTPHYREHTNQIRIRLKYRLERDSGGRLSDVMVETHIGFYLIIRTPPPKLGSVFISFKQPEDLKLANILERYATRAGFKAHVYVRAASLGAHQWDEIEQLIASCHTIFIIWAQRTDWGEGVEREMHIGRRRKLREVLIIDQGVEVPPGVRTSIAHTRFDAQDPTPAFADAVSSVRAQVLAETSS
jgi:hypothetical protein